MSIPAMPMQMTAAGSVTVVAAIVNQIYCVCMENIKALLNIDMILMMFWE